MVRLTDRPDMTLDVYHGRKTTIQQYNFGHIFHLFSARFQSFLGYIILPFEQTDSEWVC